MSHDDCSICREGSEKFKADIKKWVDDEKFIFIASIVAEGGPDDPDVRPPFAYTVGMQRNFGAPEVCLFGMTMGQQVTTMNGVANFVQAGGTIEKMKKIPEIMGEFGVVFLPISAARKEEIFHWTSWYYGEESFEVVQLVWADKNNLFPWEDGFNERYRTWQPIDSPIDPSLN